MFATLRVTSAPRPQCRARWAIVGVTAVALIAACGDDDGGGGGNDVDPATATLVYQFHDASVPPEYHRSYTLTADAESAHLVVDSYGDVLHDVTEPNDGERWERVLEESQTLANVTDVADQGCAGGTSEELRVLDGEDQAVIDVLVDHCGSSSGPDLAEVVTELLALFDLDELLATG
jgi:hypothetical protein